MWFWLFVIILVIGIGAIIIGNRSWDYERHWFLHLNNDIIAMWGWIISAVSGLVVVTMLFTIIGAHTNVEAKLEQNREAYNALVYKMESTTCRDEFGFLSKEVIDEVQEWNKDVRYRQAAQSDFWVGIFYPNVYDEFETIDYESYNTGKGIE